MTYIKSAQNRRGFAHDAHFKETRPSVRLACAHGEARFLRRWWRGGIIVVLALHSTDREEGRKTTLMVRCPLALPHSMSVSEPRMLVSRRGCLPRDEVLRLLELFLMWLSWMEPGGCEN